MVIALGCAVALRTGVKVELDVGIFFSLGAVVVRSSLDDLHVLELKAGAGRLRNEQDAEGNGGCNSECGRREESEDGLHANQ